MKSIEQKINDQVFGVINKILFKEKKKVFKFEDISLYPSEVHLMLMIRNELDTNATRMAKQLGLTKGAVSQTLTRLENKGIVKKVKDPYNKNELTLSITPRGERAYKLCRAPQKVLIRSLEEHLKTTNQEEKESIFKFLVHFENAIDSIDMT